MRRPKQNETIQLMYLKINANNLDAKIHEHKILIATVRSLIDQKLIIKFIIIMIDQYLWNKNSVSHVTSANNKKIKYMSCNKYHPLKTKNNNSI